MRHDAPKDGDSVATDTDPFLTATEAARRLRISRSTVYNLVSAGALRSHRMGQGKVRPRGLRIPASAVDEYLRNSQTPTADAA
ncbi:helix-turn-helix domain-containing protein [Streptomyces albus]|uniref:helix-turn-helix domain-containing protein n=1 Tax=Streptomyces albus TaxID=1888 RepID=UPI0024E11E8B|nr:helix-turn-helix domain-containing protein [Streptomyces albus]GHJ21655.1 hypothetical protein TPA0909_32690 [Streptomyces albus]